MPTEKTLQELAADSASDPNNPAYDPDYLSRVANDEGGLPSRTARGIGVDPGNPFAVLVQGAKTIGGGIYNGTRSLMGMDTPAEAQAAPQQAAAPPVSAPQTDTPTPQAPIVKQEPTSHGGVPGAVPVQSPMHKWEADSKASEMRDIDNQQKYIDSLDDSRLVYKAGLQSAHDQMSDAEAQFQANKLKTVQQYADFDNETRDAQKKDELEAADLRAKHVDPQKWFKDKGVAGSILAAIAIGAGAFGAAVPHTANHQNYALDIINGAINRNIEAQKDDIANQWKVHEDNVAGHSKDFARQQFFAQKGDEIALRDYGHAIFLAEQTKSQATDNYATANIDGTIATLKAAQEEKVRSIINRRLTVANYDMAQASAGRITAKQLSDKTYELFKDPNLVVPEGVDRVDAARNAAARTFGIKVPAIPGVTVVKAGSVKPGIDTSGLQASGDKAVASAGAGTGIGSTLPAWITPGSNMKQADVDAWRSNVRGTLKALEPRLTGDELEKQSAVFDIKNTDPIAVRKHRVELFMERTKTGEAVSKGKNTAPLTESE